MRKILTETLDYKDLEGQVEPMVFVDEYASNVGEDDEVVTLAFVVKGQQASEDLTDWFERGYDWILDSEVSEGQYKKGKYLVFVELDRRTKVPGRIVELIEDLQTLTDLPIEQWKIMIDDVEYKADEAVLKQVIILSPSEYRVKHEEDLNEMRERAGLEPRKLFKDKQDNLIKEFISKAGL